jgi:putative membrane protein
MSDGTARSDDSAAGGVRAWMRAVLAGVGLARPPEPSPPLPASTDRGTLLAEERTRLALERSFLAAERTLMAWIRTSLSMISFGFTMVKFIGFLAQRDVTPVGVLGRAWSAEGVGFTLVSLGTGALVVAIIQHRHTLGMLHAQGLTSRWSLSLTVATLVALLGVFAFGGLALRY